MVLNDILLLPNNLLPKKSSALLIGKNGTCKTSFLFSFSCSMALKYTDRQVIFICPNVVAKYPLTIENQVEIDSNAAKRIIMFYPKTYEELIDYLAKFFTYTNLCPSAFIIDDLDIIINRRENQQIPAQSTYKESLSRLLALIIDNVEYLRLAHKKSCELLVATAFNELNDDEDFLTIKSFANHFFEEVYHITQQLILEPASCGFEITTKNNKYTINIIVSDGEIKLKEILKKKFKPILDQQIDDCNNDTKNDDNTK